MDETLIDRLANAVLYEGYLLYPYRPSSVKNRHRWTFGCVYPQAYSRGLGGSDPWVMQTECLVAGSLDTTLRIRARFLHLVERVAAGEPLLPTWQEAIERDICLPDLNLGECLERARQHVFQFPPSQTEEPVAGPDDTKIGSVVRQQQLIAGSVELSAQVAAAGLFKITVRILNQTPLADVEQHSREQALLHTLVSTHTILQVRAGLGGAFVSLLDPPLEWQTLAAACKNVGAWPVLVGREGETDTMLSAPIILYDYPQIAPESPGNLFDATEIDEILTLRILTLTAEEKRAMAACDERGRALLERTDALSPEQLAGLHGMVRRPRPIPGPEPSNPWAPPTDRRQVECVRIGAIEARRGDRVRLRPRGGADILDSALQGMTATIETVEQDVEDQIYLAVTVDDDPGKDLGSKGLPGHRFFFRPEEVEPLGLDEDHT